MLADEGAEAESIPRVGLDRGAISDTVQQDFNPRPLSWGADAEGLVSPELATRLPLAPPLSTDTFVCLADESEFVLRSRRWGEVCGRFQPSDVERSPNGDHFVTLDAALVSGAPWLEIWRALDVRRRRVRVEPLRPVCRFLAQQMVDFGDDGQKQMLERLCTARRDDERFFVGLRDTQVHACELRSPRDAATDERIRLMNETKIKLGRERLQETGESFNVDEALRRAHQEADTQGLVESTIFKEGK